MKFYARLVEGVVVETWNDNDLMVLPSDVFVPILAAQFVECPEWVVTGTTKSGDDWILPAQEPDPVVPSQESVEP